MKQYYDNFSELLQELFSQLTPEQIEEIMALHSIQSVEISKKGLTIQQEQEEINSIIIKDKDSFYDALANFEANKTEIPPEEVTKFENKMITFDFYFNVYLPFMQEATPLLQKLYREHYPVILTDNRPIISQYIDQKIEFLLRELIIFVHIIIEDEKKGIIVRQKYTTFDSIKEFYGKPQPPHLMDDSFRLPEFEMTDEEWEAEKEEENRQMIQYHNWVEQRKDEFINLIQPIIFQSYPQINNVNADSIIIFAMRIRDAYERFLTFGEHIEGFIDAAFPDDYIYLDQKEYQKKYNQKYNKISDKLDDLRDRRIAGEKI